jgi:hypothetical protein
VGKFELSAAYGAEENYPFTMQKAYAQPQIESKKPYLTGLLKTCRMLNALTYSQALAV